MKDVQKTIVCLPSSTLFKLRTVSLGLDFSYFQIKNDTILMDLFLMTLSFALYNEKEKKRLALWLSCAGFQCEDPGFKSRCWPLEFLLLGASYSCSLSGDGQCCR